MFLRECRMADAVLLHAPPDAGHAAQITQVDDESREPALYPAAAELAPDFVARPVRAQHEPEEDAAVRDRPHGALQDQPGGLCDTLGGDRTRHPVPADRTPHGRQYEGGPELRPPRD